MIASKSGKMTNNRIDCWRVLNPFFLVQKFTNMDKQAIIRIMDTQYDSLISIKIVDPVPPVVNSAHVFPLKKLLKKPIKMERKIIQKKKFRFF